MIVNKNLSLQKNEIQIGRDFESFLLDDLFGCYILLVHLKFNTHVFNIGPYFEGQTFPNFVITKISYNEELKSTAMFYTAPKETFLLTLYTIIFQPKWLNFTS